MTYRGVIELLEVSDALRARLGLIRLPHFPTLKKFSVRSDVLAVIDAMLLEVVREFAPRDDTESAIDSTGMETTAASAHFQSLCGRQRRKVVKVSVCVMNASLLPFSLVLRWGQTNDKKEAADLLAKAIQVNRPERLLADAGIDAEWVHELCRDDWQVEGVVKPAVHRSDGGLNGRYRLQMTEEHLKEKGFGKRWLVESFMSGLTRTTGAALNARTEASLFVEAGLRVLA